MDPWIGTGSWWKGWGDCSARAEIGTVTRRKGEGIPGPWSVGGEPRAGGRGVIGSGRERCGMEAFGGLEGKLGEGRTCRLWDIRRLGRKRGVSAGRREDMDGG